MTEENRTENQEQQTVQKELSLREKVFEACHDIEISGEKITRALVREKTGGSDRDLSKYIREYRESVQSEEVESTESELAIREEGTVSSKNEDLETEEIEYQQAYSDKPEIDMAAIARRGAEKAAALLVGEQAVTNHLLENPDQLPPDLKKQVEFYQAKTKEIEQKRQEQYDPDFFAKGAIAQLAKMK